MGSSEITHFTLIISPPGTPPMGPWHSRDESLVRKTGSRASWLGDILESALITFPALWVLQHRFISIITFIEF